MCKCVTYHAPAHGVNIPHSTHSNTHTHTHTHIHIHVCVCVRERERERDGVCVFVCYTLQLTCLLQVLPFWQHLTGHREVVPPPPPHPWPIPLLEREIVGLYYN